MPFGRPEGTATIGVIRQWITHGATGHGKQTRWSVVCELTPRSWCMPTGVRLSDGIPQGPVEHTRLLLLELRGLFRGALKLARQ